MSPESNNQMLELNMHIVSGFLLTATVPWGRYRALLWFYLAMIMTVMESWLVDIDHDQKAKFDCSRKVWSTWNRPSKIYCVTHGGYWLMIRVWLFKFLFLFDSIWIIQSLAKLTYSKLKWWLMHEKFSMVSCYMICS